MRARLSFRAMSAVLLTVLLPMAATARSASYRQMLMASQGIAHPAFSALAGQQNPAGLIFGSGAQLYLDAQSPSTQLSNPEFGTDLLFGGASWGGGIGAQLRTGAGPGGGDVTLGRYGLAAEIPGIHTAFGFAGSTGINNSNGTSIDVGMLVGPYDSFTIGLAAFGVTGGIDTFGAGFNWMLARTFAVVADTTTDSAFSTFHVQPGLWLGNATSSLTVSYAVDVGATTGNGELAVGAALLLGHRINWQIYYQQINRLYTGLSFSL